MQKLSKAEAGKLGAEKSKLVTAQAKQIRINSYNENPNTCTNCHNKLSYIDRHKKFCTSSCAAKYNNVRREKISKTWNCLFCNKVHTGRVGKFCNTNCQKEHEYNDRVHNWIHNSDSATSKGTIKRYLTEQHGYNCSICGINNWNNKTIVLEIEHKDGNSLNNHISNLCLICPNCHSQTDTYKGKNKGKGRHARRIRYQEGKSY